MSEVFPRDMLLRVGGRALDEGVLAIPGAGRRAVELKETVTRASVGYFLDRDGIIRKAAVDKARDYWPVGLVDAKGRQLHGPLCEGARTNGWATVTENYSDAAWVKSGCTFSSNVHVAPDGVLASADKMVESAVNELHFFSRAITGMTDNTRTSVWWLVKAAERTWLRVFTNDKANTPRSTWFNLATGVVGTKDSGHDAWIRPLGLGYYFISVSFDAASGATGPVAGLRLALSDGGAGYAGDGASGIYVWESGVEVDKPFPSHPGSILPNGLARAADLITVDFNFGPLPEGMSIFMDLERTLHADATGTIGQVAGIYDLGNAANDHAWAYFEATSRAMTFAIQPTGGGGSAPSGSPLAIPAGNRLRLLQQIKEFSTGPKVAADTGAGLTAFGGASANPLTKFSQQVLRVGDIINSGDGMFGVLLDLPIFRGLATRAEAMAAADA